jgi:hypothetical protein
LAKLSESAVSYVGGEKHEKLKTTTKRRRSEDDDDDDAERKARQAGMGRSSEGRKKDKIPRRTIEGRQFHAKLYRRRVRNWRSRKQEKKYRPFGQAGSSGHPAGPYLGLRVSIPLISKLGRFPRFFLKFKFKLPIINK